MTALPTRWQESFDFFKGTHEAGFEHFDTAEGVPLEILPPRQLNGPLLAAYHSGPFGEAPTADTVFNETQLGQ